jgi:hypothetical protein
MTTARIAIVLVALGAAVFATIRWPRAMSVNVWAFVATVLLTAAVIIVLPAPFAAKVLWVGLALPLLWVALQWWAYWDERRWRPTASMIALSAIGATIVVTMDPAL